MTLQAGITMQLNAGSRHMPRTSHLPPPCAKPFLADMQNLRERARHCIDEDMATDGHIPNPETVLKLLYNVLAAEIVCTLRYQRYRLVTSATQSRTIIEQFVAHANEEQQHVERIEKRILALGGMIDRVHEFAPDDLLGRSQSACLQRHTLLELIKEDILVECLVMDNYRDIVRCIGEQDSSTRDMLQSILAAEEKHAHELADLLESLPD